MFNLYSHSMETKKQTISAIEEMRREIGANSIMINNLITGKNHAEAVAASMEMKNRELLLEVANLKMEIERLKSRGLIARILNR